MNTNTINPDIDSNTNLDEPIIKSIPNSNQIAKDSIAEDEEEEYNQDLLIQPNIDKHEYPSYIKKHGTSHPYDSNRFIRVFQYLTHYWFYSIVKLGYHKDLQPDDCYQVPVIDSINENAKLWTKFINERKQKGLPINTAAIIWQIEKHSILDRFFWSTVAKLAQLSVPFLISSLTSFFEDTTQPFRLGIFYSLLLLVAGIFNTLVFNYAFTSAARALSRIKAYLIFVIYEKSLAMSLSASSPQQQSKNNKKNKLNSTAITMGQKLTMIAADTRSIAFFVGWAPIMVSNLVLSIAVVIFLYLEVGAAAFFGWSFMIVVGGPLQYIVGKKIVSATRKYLKASDKRVKFITELIQGIRVTKMYAWENALMSKVGLYRDEEAKRLLIRVKYMALMTMLNIATPQFMALILFAVYIALGNELTLSKTFAVISLIQLLRISIKIIPYAVMLAIGSYVGCNRLNNLFSSIDKDCLMDNNECDKWNVYGDDVMLEMKHASFRWNAKVNVLNDDIHLVINKEISDDTLKDLCFSVNKGELIAVVGSVGCGKSSLIAAILGEIKLTQGYSYCDCGDSIAYASQQPFIVNGTVRSNILFGLEYEEEYYNRVIEASALLDDLDVLANADLTEIGERGINLSGGQKQRISFARALYRSRVNKINLYLFDDPLSAVDVDVGATMFHEGILDLLQYKTRLIVMNSHLDLLQYCDKILIIDNGMIVAYDTYENVMNNNQFAHLLPKKSETVNKKKYENTNIQKSVSLTRNFSYKPGLKDMKDIEERRKKGKLIVAEDRSKKSIPISMYAKYFSQAGMKFDHENIKYDSDGNKQLNMSNSFGIIMIIIEIILLIGSQTFDTMADIWIAFWSEEYMKQRYPNKTNEWWLMIWSIFIVCLSIFAFTSSSLFGYLSTKSAMNVHQKTLWSVLRAPILYFDSTPTGRIINRFSKDTNEMDDGLQINFNNFAQTFLQICGYLILIIYSVPFTLILLIFAIPIFYLLQNKFRMTSRSLKRLDQITFSPIMAQFSESLLGLDTIRSYNLFNSFLNKFKIKVNINHKVSFHESLSSRWFGSNMDVLIILLLLMVALISCWLSRSQNIFSFDISLLSLALVYSYSLTSTIQWSMRAFVDVEKNFTAVERLLHYENQTPQEANNINVNYRPNKQWPNDGKLVIKNLKMRYRTDLDLVLNNINAEIKPGEKIGICGRTGSGKSSLLVSLFRLVEPENESVIMIDNIDCIKLGLTDLRKNISIIPQEPVLFSGSLRFNLDPFNNYNDEQIWDILKKIKLYNFINDKSEKLQYKIAESGSNFSQGQKQLICIGRALLKQSKLLLLDEATSSIDKYTDQLIQNLIRKEFNDKTVLCIAHRINTIRDYDRIMVLSKGNIVEFDNPNVLLKNKNGIFSSMVNDSVSNNHINNHHIIEENNF